MASSTNTAIGKQGKGIPIAVPTNQRRLSHFSVKTANRALMTGYRDGGGSTRRRSSTSLQGHQSFSYPPRKGNERSADSTRVVLVKDYPLTLIVGTMDA